MDRMLVTNCRGVDHILYYIALLGADDGGAAEEDEGRMRVHAWVRACVRMRACVRASERLSVLLHM